MQWSPLSHKQKYPPQQTQNVQIISFEGSFSCWRHSVPSSQHAAEISTNRMGGAGHFRQGRCSQQWLVGAAHGMVVMVWIPGKHRRGADQRDCGCNGVVWAAQRRVGSLSTPHSVSFVHPHSQVYGCFWIDAARHYLMTSLRFTRAHVLDS